MPTHTHTFARSLSLSGHTYLTALNAYKISKSSKSRKIRVSCTFAAFMSPSTSLMDESNAFYASFGCLQMYLFMSTCSAPPPGWGVGMGRELERGIGKWGWLPRLGLHHRPHENTRQRRKRNRAEPSCAQRGRGLENHQVQSLATFMSRAAVASKNEEHLPSPPRFSSEDGHARDPISLQRLSPGDLGVSAGEMERWRAHSCLWASGIVVATLSAYASVHLEEKKCIDCVDKGYVGEGRVESRGKDKVFSQLQLLDWC